MHPVLLMILLVGLLLLGCMLVITRILCLRLKIYRTAIGYDITADYRFSYDEKRGNTVDLVVGDNDLEWPALENSWQSAFIELTVRSSILGQIVDPGLEMRLGAQVLRHYIERGGSGRRIFNVTPFLQSSPAAGSSIVIRGRHLGWLKSAGARLHLLREAEPPPGPLLVLAPHPDDAEIAAFGLFSQRPSWIVTVTLGDAGPSLYSDFFESKADAYNEKVHIRVWDSIAIPRMADVPQQQIVNLGYFDSTLAAMLQSPDTPIKAPLTGQADIARFRVNPLDGGQPPHEATWRNLVADMKKLLLHIQPAAVVLPHPRLDPHPDHQCTTFALLEAMQEVGPLQGCLLFYTNHLPGTELYPYGPGEGIVSIPPIHDDSIRFQSVLSIPLDNRTRLRKRIALETHHDLRPALNAATSTLWKKTVNALKTPYLHLVSADNDYVRRAVRPNEIFFVTDYDQAGRLHNEFLAFFLAKKNHNANQDHPSPASRR